MTSAAHPGFVYVLINPSIAGMVKVGRTERHPDERRAELSAATGVPTPFDLKGWVFFDDCHLAEERIHHQWERDGKRVAKAREFFQLSPEAALHDLNQLALTLNAAPGGTAAGRGRSSPQAEQAKTALEEGFIWMRGDVQHLRNPQRALEYFERAAMLGHAAGSYWAGAMAETLGREVRRKQDKHAWEQRAIQHYREAMAKGHIKACARATWLFRRAKQYHEADHHWRAFMDLLAEQPQRVDAESARWLWNEAVFREKYHRTPWFDPHPLWGKARSAIWAGRPEALSTPLMHAFRRAAGVQLPWWFWAGLAIASGGLAAWGWSVVQAFLGRA